MTRDEARKLARDTYDKLGQGSVYDERAIHAAIVAAHDSALEDAASDPWITPRKLRARKIGGGGNG